MAANAGYALTCDDTFPRLTGQPADLLIPSRPRDRRRGAHRKPGHRLAKAAWWNLTVPLLAVIALVLAVAAPALVPRQRVTASTIPMRVRALDWAEAQAGKPYIYGGTGPYGFDCSGLVMMAWLRGAGVSLPRTSYQIAADLSRLRIIPVSQARRGDILVYPGAGHVELKTRARNGSFGALEPGTRIGWHRWNAYWHPVFALALR